MEDIPGLNEIPDPQRPAQPAPAPTPAQQQGYRPDPSAPDTIGSFEFNRPTIIAGLYLVAPLLGITGLIGLVLAYIWRSEQPGSWEASHYTYLIRTFWIWLVVSLLGFVLVIVFIGLLILLAIFVWTIVRAVMSVVQAQKHEPMPDPQTWLV